MSDSTTSGFTLFATAIGRCGIAWSEAGIVAVQLPERRDEATRARVARRAPVGGRESAAPRHVRDAMDAISALLAGEATPLDAVVLDMRDVPEFARRVYEVARTIPPGRTLTYGEVARLVGDPGAARAVGRALGQNPFAIVVPCHRVVAAGGAIGGFSANGGAVTKRRMLAIEGATAPTLFDPPR